MELLQLYRVMVTAREIDRLEAELVRRGDASFHVSGRGHEGAAVLASVLTPHDWLHCHYRDKALMLARGVRPQEFFDALYCTAASHSRGRQMSAHMFQPELRIMSIPGPVGNNALHAVGMAAQIKHDPHRPISLCSVGDGTTQQGEFLEACGEAARDALPVLFFIEDNRWAISTDTSGRTFYSLPDAVPAHLFGMPILHLDGRDVTHAAADVATIVSIVRQSRCPAVVVFHVERLTSHTNADDQTLYRSNDDIRESAAAGDPIENLERHLVGEGHRISELQRIQESVIEEVARAEAAAAANPDPAAEHDAKRPLPQRLVSPSAGRRASADGPRLTMKDAIGKVLEHHLASDPRVTLYGQDIEDPKGDVFGVTRGLSTRFGQRVRNSPLAEATIVGTAIGRALAGGKPVAFLQFADFLPLAYNQIFSELGSMYWRTAGQAECPVIILAACGGFRPGLGPFHAQTFESVAVHTPGLDVFMPATAEDAAGLLNAAFESNRPTLFFYPKSALNDPENTTSADVHEQLTPIGSARVVRSGRAITLVGWGNTVRTCCEVAAVLDTVGFDAEVIDLRSLSPWDEQTVIASAEQTGYLVVVHEDNHSCGLGAEVVATVSERARVPVATRRVTRSDTFVPCNFTNQLEVLPTFPRVLATVAELLDLELTWNPKEVVEQGVAYIDAVGSGPADETVIVTQWHVQPGQNIKRGDVVASLEATKSVFDLTASVEGTLLDLLVTEGDTVAVGQHILKLAISSDANVSRRLRGADPGIPQLVARRNGHLKVTTSQGKPRSRQVGLVGVQAVSGSRRVANASLVSGSTGLNDQQVVDRTGIASRHWLGEGESAVGMAAAACRALLTQHQLSLADIDLMVCTTTTPERVTPSTACQILNELTEDGTEPLIQAYDINAACSGYLYALQAGYDYLQTRPDARVLVVTAEALSPLLDTSDQDTVFLFGDASSATLLVGESRIQSAQMRIFPPDLCAKRDELAALTVPLAGEGCIQMNGRKVFAEAVRAMLSSLNRACRQQQLSIGDLDLIVPHQANDRITEAIRRRVTVDVFSNIQTHGNTSSTSIPLCLADVLPTLAAGKKVGLCAFGGGFTFGATVLESLRDGSALATAPQKARRAS